MHVLTKPSAQATATATRPEVELLLCCARTHVNTATAKRIEFLLEQDIDWADLIKTAAHHKVMPLLYQSLNNTCPEAVPQGILTQLRNHFHSNTIRNLFLTNKLLKLLNLFEAQGISVIPYKGPVLAVSVYGSLSLRQFCDLDILVHSQDVTKARNLLLSQGYQLQVDLDWEQQFLQEDSGVSVDLHWGLTPKHFPGKVVFEDLWQRLESVSLAGKSVANFSPEDLLVVLCVQIAKDCCTIRAQLSKLCDVAQLLHVRQALNWGLVMEQANRLGSERLLLFGLSLTSELLGTVLPDEVKQKIQTDLAIKLYVKQVRKRLFSKTDDLPGVFECYLIRLLPTEWFPTEVSSKRQLVWSFLRLAIAPSRVDKHFLPLPSSLDFLYYLIRPLRLSGQYGLKLLRGF